MTLDEAISCLKADKEYLVDNKVCDGEEIDVAIEALEKQIPKKPIDFEDRFWGCPSCNNNLLMKWYRYPEELMSKEFGLEYCLRCGQAIDWSDEE